MKAKQILKYTLPATAPLGILAISVALRSHGTLPTQIKSTQTEIGETAVSTDSATAPSVDVKVNGQSVPVAPNSVTHVDTGNGQATVAISGQSQVVKDNGSVSISVSSSSNNSSGSTHTTISGGSSGSFSSHSSVQVYSSGTGNVNITK